MQPGRLPVVADLAAELASELGDQVRCEPEEAVGLAEQAQGEFEVQGFPIHEGDFVAASPAISNRIPEDFPDPDDFHPDRMFKNPL